PDPALPSRRSVSLPGYASCPPRFRAWTLTPHGFVTSGRAVPAPRHRAAARAQRRGQLPDAAGGDHLPALPLRHAPPPFALAPLRVAPAPAHRPPAAPVSVLRLGGRVQAHRPGGAAGPQPGRAAPAPAPGARRATVRPLRRGHRPARPRGRGPRVAGARRMLVRGRPLVRPSVVQRPDGPAP